MTAINVTRVTVDQTNEDDLFSFRPCKELQEEGKQIVRARCGHLMEEQGLIRWALTIINRPMSQDRVVRCPLCRRDLTNQNFPSINYPQIVRTRANQAATQPPLWERGIVMIDDPFEDLAGIVYSVCMIAAFCFTLMLFIFPAEDQQQVNAFFA